MLGLEAPIGSGSGSAQAASDMVMVYGVWLMDLRSRTPRTPVGTEYVNPVFARLADPSPWNWTHLFDYRLGFSLVHWTDALIMSK